MSTTAVAIVIVALVVAALVAVWAGGARRRTRLREQFGPEYSRTVHEMGSRRRAEAELAARRERVERFPLRPLTEMERAHFSNRWHDAQAAFVDDPRAAI